MTQTIEQLTARVHELEEENARLKRTNSSYVNLTKAQESQLSNLRQRLCQLKGADSAIDSERQANCDLTVQLAAEQLNNKRLRDALNQTNFWLEGALQCKEWNWEPDQRECADGCLGYAKEVLASPSDTSALYSFVDEKVKELEAELTAAYKSIDDNWTSHQKIVEANRQRDLAVEALKEMLEYAGIIEERCDSIATDKARAAIKESEVKG